MSDGGRPKAAPLILVADDDETVRLMVREALELAGFRVVEAHNGAQAVHHFTACHPDLVVLDVRMPEMDGFTACKTLRTLPGGATTPILILTGFDDVDSVTRAYDAGATDFASKPINLLILQHRVRYMLRAKRALDELRQSQARLSAAQRIARLGHWERDLLTGTLTWSDEIFRIFGVERGDRAPAFSWYLERVHPEDREQVARTTEQALRREGPYSIDVRLVRPDGKIRFVHEEAEVVYGADGRPERISGTTQDITERKETENQIRFLAYYDGLTLLPNRRLFMEQLALAVTNAKRQSRPLGLLFIDLDRFKRINDTLGHAFGDRLLQQVSERLRKCLRSSDGLSRGDPAEAADAVARLAGDEFLVSLPEITRGEDAGKVARRILDSLAEPFKIDEHEVVLTGSIGISIYPEDGEEVETLLRNADSAMYHAKEAGLGGFQFYSRSMNASARRRLSLETSLRKALDRNEFLLYYQPLLDVLATSQGGWGRILGAEALIRWKHPDLGLVPPGDFIPLAEETGLIVPLGEWVLRTAVEQVQAWHDQGYQLRHVSVNLSGRQFRQQAQLVRAIELALRAAGLDPGRLDLEITESVLMRNAEDTVKSLHLLKEMGLRVSVDDFGTGYSSLAYLTRFPIDTLKIDQSFVRDITTDPADATIVQAIIAMAKSLNLGVVAEGVETRDQLVFLRDRGCRVMQGYLFSKPVPAEEFVRLLERRPTARPAAADGI
ncbi:MAG: putative bifunctional diguanylate cyclase/phosphodiesterase [Candidatus Polarisedimenticolia bacterium]